MLEQRSPEKFGQRSALIYADDHETPGCETAVIRNARGDLEHRAERILVRARAGEIARFCRPARLQEREGGRTVV
jgi:hypothetical protein